MKVDGSFIATILETAAVVFIFLGWRGITEGAWRTPPCICCITDDTWYRGLGRRLLPIIGERKHFRHLVNCIWYVVDLLLKTHPQERFKPVCCLFYLLWRCTSYRAFLFLWLPCVNARGFPHLISSLRTMLFLSTFLFTRYLSPTRSQDVAVFWLVVNYTSREVGPCGT